LVSEIKGRTYTEVLRTFENRVLREIFGQKRDEDEGMVEKTA
jgi:hypothetical protein